MCLIWSKVIPLSCFLITYLINSSIVTLFILLYIDSNESFELFLKLIIVDRKDFLLDKLKLLTDPISLNKEFISKFSFRFIDTLLDLKLHLFFINKLSFSSSSPSSSLIFAITISLCSRDIIALRFETTFCIFGRSSASYFQHS